MKEKFLDTDQINYGLGFPDVRITSMYNVVPETIEGFYEIELIKASKALRRIGYKELAGKFIRAIDSAHAYLNLPLIDKKRKIPKFRIFKPEVVFNGNKK